MLEIEINDDASPMLEELSAAAEPEQILQVAAKRIANELKEHFSAKNAEGNKQDWAPQNFWNRIRSATAVAEVTPVDATIVVSDPAFNQKVYGGTITPKRCANLAIPATAAAYASGSPREGGGPNLTFAFGWDPDRGVWRPALVAKYNYQRRVQKGKNAGKLVKGRYKNSTEGVGTVWYWLVKSVTQQPDESALPAQSDVEDAIHDELSMTLACIAERNAA